MNAQLFPAIQTARSTKKSVHQRDLTARVKSLAIDNEVAQIKSQLFLLQKQEDGDDSNHNLKKVSAIPSMNWFGKRQNLHKQIAVAAAFAPPPPLSLKGRVFGTEIADWENEEPIIAKRKEQQERFRQQQEAERQREDIVKEFRKHEAILKKVEVEQKLAPPKKAGPEKLSPMDDLLSWSWEKDLSLDEVDEEQAKPIQKTKKNKKKKSESPPTEQQPLPPRKPQLPPMKLKRDEHSVTHATSAAPAFTTFLTSAVTSGEVVKPTPGIVHFPQRPEDIELEMKRVKQIHAAKNQASLGMKNAFEDAVRNDLIANCDAMREKAEKLFRSSTLGLLPSI